MPTERRSGPHDVRRAHPRAPRGVALRHPASYHEGERAGLAEAMRIVTTAGPVDACAALREALALWTHRANSLSASPTPALRAYHQGGRDALQAFLDAEQHDATHPHPRHG